MKKILRIFLCIIFCTSGLFAQNDSTKIRKKGKKRKAKRKTGWTLGALPSISYDSDIGYKYGAIVNFFNFGDGSTYPAYRHSIFLEWSRTTKGTGLNIFAYDSKYLIPNIRTTLDVNYFTEQALDFFGFNGYEAFYNSNFEDDEHNDYISRMYYRHSRNMLRISADFQGVIIKNKLLWIGGLLFYDTKIGTVNIDKLNKGKDDDDLLPNNDNRLYDNYVKWGIIKDDQKNGGNVNFLKAGLVYDTRDNEPNPMKGIWTEAFLLMAPSFLGNDYAYTQLCFTHRQYFTVIPKVLNFAVRIGYQAKIGGEIPFYMLPHIFYSNKRTRDGLGGGRSLRGIMRNRIVGEDYLYGNMELRWKFLRTVIKNQNFYFALSGFLDGGIVTGKYEFNQTLIPQSYNDDYYLRTDDKEKLHLSYGMGLHIAMNENFILAIDYGMANDKRDGNRGLYILLDFLF